MRLPAACRAATVAATAVASAAEPPVGHVRGAPCRYRAGVAVIARTRGFGRPAWHDRDAGNAEPVQPFHTQIAGELWIDSEGGAGTEQRDRERGPAS